MAEEPLVLLRDHAELYRLQFPGDALPVKAPTDIVALLDFDQSYGCRGGAVQGSSQAPTLNLEPPAAGGQLERVANLFFEKMQDVCNSQQRMLECFMTGGSTAKFGAMATDGRPRFPVKRLPTITFGSDGGSDGGESSTLVATPQRPSLPSTSSSPAAAAASASGLAIPLALPAPLLVPSTPPPVIVASTQGSTGARFSSLELLDMLDEREADKKERGRAQVLYISV